jgi:hypothetical protein
MVKYLIWDDEAMRILDQTIERTGFGRVTPCFLSSAPVLGFDGQSYHQDASRQPCYTNSFVEETFA